MVASLKENIISKIQHADNEQLLAEIFRILEADQYVFTEEEIALLNEADLAISEGRFAKQEEVEKRINTWLKDVK